MHDVTTIIPSSSNAFLSDVVEGLSRDHKTLPCRWLYDERGSDLFEKITGLEDYYPTRAETQVLRDRAPEIAAFAGEGPILIEYGAGAGVKTELVLGALRAPRGYVPIDVAEEYLADTARRIGRRFPSLWVQPVQGDFLNVFDMPQGMPAGRRVAFFPGSTIGNLEAAEAAEFLAQMRRHVGGGGGGIVGVDLRKDVPTLLRAYDDRDGVTARFNLNLLVRINRELRGDFRLKGFRHAARWNEAESAVEMHLVSQTDQWASVEGRRFHFRKGETIHTESSRKYDREGFAELAESAGWRIADAWTDATDRFCVFALSPA